MTTLIDNSSTFLMNGTPFASYDDLTATIENLFQVRHEFSSEKTETLTTSLLPKEISHQIASYFTVKKVDPNDVRVVQCSSSSNQHELEECLVDSNLSWWISAFRSMDKGVGREFVEFELSATTLVRLSEISISIPPLPMGPLSVRTMRVDSFDGSKWNKMTPVLQVESMHGWQRLELETPIDAQLIRVVCLSNQASRFLTLGPEDIGPSNVSAVGFYSIKFQ